MITRVLGTSLDSRFRFVVVVAAVIAAIAHVPVIRPHLDEAPYMGVLFVVLTVACVTLAVTVVAHDGSRVYGLAILTCGLAVVGYAATRLVAFPMLSDDVGNWLEPLGIVSVVSESVVVVAAAIALHGHRRSGSAQRGQLEPSPVGEVRGAGM
ncbi:hypothetical protein GCM10011492_36220 [Flexivirga endophytica]|uniref:Uncharacterized protein n=1 Tax=Flexivirga endophytica TaxID=1849103 RepID=A0A916TEJ3_9MICO|nr:hypothetical protein [Flexivirga endophytica]GGB42024.1 hypothetical protein GCM10011492_36220 [Flexivirga endophytica]GHB69318.1 hypothetical protein GCM10008112_42360 [Flexivirga endophytica]